MTTELDPIGTTEQLRQSYMRYLKTIYPLQNQALRRQFWQQLEEPDRLVKGPLLEGAPPFQIARSLSQLMRDGILSRDFGLLGSEALPLDRPLYAHQDKAIEKSICLRRNLVIATGTGSGKTEAFLIPILNHCLREREQGTLNRAGIRALLLYPMNALANDQMKRLRRILANFPEITFGRYIGETEETRVRAEERFRDQFPSEFILPNELLSREEMRRNPPHILLTNYAMLEYLLLRPADSEFFDGPTAGRWRFVVLDEAHTYDGAMGIEIAMLLRRLKDRIVKSEKGHLTCMATSATLGSRQDFQGVVAFASDLFGEDFEWKEDDPKRQDVIFAERIPLNALGTPWGEGDPELYRALWKTLQNEATPSATVLDFLQQQAILFGIDPGIWKDSKNAVERFLYRILERDARVQRLREMLAESPDLFTTIASHLFPNQTEGSSALAALVSLAVRARLDANSLPLIPARYHLFARALEGAFTCLRDHREDHTEGTASLADPRLYLARRETCPVCEEQGRKGRVFELASCTRCGREYLVGRIVQASQGGLFEENTGLAHLQQLVVDFGEIRGEKGYFLIDTQLSTPDEDEETALGEELSESEVTPYILCTSCGAIAPQADGELKCPCADHSAAHLRVLRVDLKGHGELRHCASCGSRSTGEIVYRFLPGQDAPVSVLATALYQQIPPARDATDKPGEGRKLLIFSDSRQDAAFFAAYMEHTYRTLLRRRLIIKALAEHPDAATGMLRLQDLVTPVLKQAEDAGLFTQRQSFAERKELAWTWLMQEFLAFDRRISPEGVGLLSFRLVKPAGWRALAPLSGAPWNLTPDEQWMLLRILLDSLRQQGVVTFPDSVSPNGNDAFAPRARELFMRESASDPKAGILSWLPSRGSNRRVELLIRLLQSRAPSLSESDSRKLATDTLAGLWRECLTGPQSIWREHLAPLNRARNGIVYRIDHHFWEIVPTLTPAAQADHWKRCSQCGILSSLDLGICPTPRCSGKLIPFDPMEAPALENHYRHLYLGLHPIPFSVEEHTAQWTSAQAAVIQEKFVKGEVNALSCSTTFELGVDVGELQAVLMRNVPPTTANYVQRAGRAGRRTDATAFAFTYAQRRSHDLAHYANPKRIVSGKIRPPAFDIANEKIVRRHAHSVIFASFFRAVRDQRNQLFRSIGDFFDAEPGALSGPELLNTYLDSRPESVREALERIVPQELKGELGIADWTWIKGLTNADANGVLDNAQHEVKNDLDTFSQLMQEARDQNRGYELERYKRILATLRGKDLLGFLGSRNILPKYGFPVDVVELKTDHLQLDEAKKLELDRDLRIALSEYAPGGQIVAAKRVWTSGGLYRRPDKGWPEYHYAVCPECGRFNSSAAPLDGVCKTCKTSLTNRLGLRGQFIQPLFGFVADPREPRAPGEARPERTYTSRVFFADYDTEIEPEIETDDSFPMDSTFAIGKRYSRHGKLAVINAGPQGRGFRICLTCGRGEIPPPSTTKRRNAPREHENPRTGRSCRGTFVHRHLGHEFLTDVLELRLIGSLCRSQGEGLWRSLLYAILEGAADALSIRRDDLDGCIYRYNLAEPPAIMLFDNVPGGAGQVKRIGQNLKPVFISALERVARCECGPETSCYECLRNYRNQPYHEVLARGPVAEFLSQIVEMR